MIIRPRGPVPAKYLVVGDAGTGAETKAGVPFVGSRGNDLHKLLNEAGIAPEHCRFTHVVLSVPPKGNPNELICSSKKAGLAAGANLVDGKWAMPELLEGRAALHREIVECQPEKIIGLGNFALWACTGEWGITKWRGSQLECNIDNKTYNFIPTYGPGWVQARYHERWIVLEDLKRAAKLWEKPNYDFIIRPSYTECVNYLHSLLDRLVVERVKIASDIETRQRQIACVGLATTDRSAICIPFLCTETPTGYWTVEEEFQLVRLLDKVLSHKNAHVIGQNYIYDKQYFARIYGINSNLSDDTMLKHHTCFPGTQKGLDFLSSIYCRYHRYWKDESKDWDPKMGEEQLWEYNCKDCCATFEANENLDEVVEAFGLKEQYAFQMRTNDTAFRMVLRGMRVDRRLKAENSVALAEAMVQIRDWITSMLGGYQLFGPKGVSSQKMSRLAYDILKLPPKYKVINKKRRLTSDKDAIKEWATTCEIVFRPLLSAISLFRSLQVYKSTFADCGIDHDSRIRCSINVSGTETFRWSTSADAFNFGTNLQNIPGNQKDG